MRTRRGEIAPLVRSDEDGMKQQMVKLGIMVKSAHCDGYNRVVCSKRICPQGPESAPILFAENGMWVGVHCFACYQKSRPLYDAWYDVQIRLLLTP